MTLEHTNLAREFYNSTKWRKLRKRIMIENDFKCNRCNQEGKIVHHIEKITIDNIHDKRITLNSDNLEVLCMTCHNREHHGEFKFVDKHGNPKFAFDLDGRPVVINEMNINDIVEDERGQLIYYKE